MSQRRAHFPVEKDILFDVKIVGGLQDSEHYSVGTRLSACFPCRQSESNVITTSGSTSFVKYKLKKRCVTKQQLFELVRRKWCSEICKVGTPFWLESAESIPQTFTYKGEISPRQILDVESFSIGSFYDRGTFIEHFSSRNGSTKGPMISVEFEHDSKKMEIILLENAFPEMFVRIPGMDLEHRIEFEYKQFEEYVVIEENRSQEIIDVYVPLKWPPIVSEGSDKRVSEPKSSSLYLKEKEVYFDVKIVGGLQDSGHHVLGEKLTTSFPSRKENGIVTLGRTSFVNYSLKCPKNATKQQFFEVVRRKWFTEICKKGMPFWLESVEKISQIFPCKFEISPAQNLEVEFFSFGSFYNRGTFIEHFNSAAISNKGTISVEFEHGQMEIISILHSLEYRIEFEYKQFEEYVVIEENGSKEIIDFYISLKWPPKVSKAVPNGEFTNFIRCTSFPNCEREVLGKSCVLRLRFALPKENEQNLPEQLMIRLGRLGFSICFAAIRTKSPRGPTEVPAKPIINNFDVSFALECLLSRGYKVSDRVTRYFYDLLRKATARLGAIISGEKALTNNEICRALYHLIAFVENDRFCHLEDILEQLLFGAARRKAETAIEIPKHYVYVPRIIITPTQDYLVQPELVAENRVIREYGHEFTMRIAFRDEDFSKLTSHYHDGLRDVLKARVRDLLSEGFQISGRHFEFLACSNSQLRQHGAWLYAHDGMNCSANIRNSLGELKGIRCVATYVSRMGQCFSSTKKAVEVSLDSGVDVSEIPEITKEYKDVYFKCCGNYRSGTYTFSDGIGKISKALGEKVAKSLGLERRPSAYQIRYAGCKGMLAVDPSLRGGDTRKILQYRQSMRKFDSDHEALEICEATRPNLLYLNRQCITLLSGLDVPDEVFIKLQDTMLMRLASMLLFETVALETLSRANIAGGLKISALRQSGINATCEPFYRSLLLAIYRSKLGDLLRRARIAVPETHGRLMMGVLDETGSLEYGQVFIRYTTDIADPSKGITTLIGDVVVSKNPCFHPGDMRKFQAVDIRALHHLVDCIVFPSHGPRPHTDEMSGSDLDGDKYFVTWFDGLIPPGENVDPMDFTAPTKKVLNREIEVSDMIQFVSDYIKNDQLGIIANAHLVHADNDHEGIFSEECIKLAHMHSDAVDFPKTGECPELTKELRPDRYPDFMMKPDKPKYKSERIIGTLFRKCNSLERARRFMTEEGTPQITVDQYLILEGHQDFIEEAIELKERYNTKLEALMALYGLTNEGEVLTGCLVKVNSRLSGKTDEKFEVAQMIQASLASLRNNLRHEFYEEFGGEEEVLEFFNRENSYPLDVLQKASAWYVVTYKNLRPPEEEQRMEKDTPTVETRSGGILGGTGGASLAAPHVTVGAAHVATTSQARDRETGSDITLLSFPWVVDRLLAHIKREATKNRKRGANEDALEEGIGHLATQQAEHRLVEKQEDLISDFEVRNLQRQTLLKQLRKYDPNIRISLAGASFIGPNIGDKNQQPFQLYIHNNWIKSERKQKELLDAVGRILSPYLGHQFLSSYGNPPYLMYKTTGVDNRSCYLSADPYAFLKSAYITFHIQQCPRLLHVLLVLVQWARKRHLVGNVKESFMIVEDLAVLVLQFCEVAGYIPEVPMTEVQGYANEIVARPADHERSWKTQVLRFDDESLYRGFLDGASPGLVIVKFLERYSLETSSDPLHLTNVMNPVKQGERLFPVLSHEGVQRLMCSFFLLDSNPVPPDMKLGNDCSFTTNTMTIVMSKSPFNIPSPSTGQIRVKIDHVSFSHLATSKFCDAALHAYHEIATCNGLDGLLRSADHADATKEVQETLTLPNSTWGVIRFAEDFVALGIAKISGAKISVSPVKRGPGYHMEIFGTYNTLYKAQNEIYKMETRTKDTSAYNHLIKGGKRLIFMDQSGDSAIVRSKNLKRDFAINLDAPNSSIEEDLRKLMAAVDTQVRVFQSHHLPYLHGSTSMRISVEFGSIYVAKAYAWVSGTTVRLMESVLQAADPRNQGNKSNQAYLRWSSSSSNSATAHQIAFSDVGPLRTTTVYVVETKEGKAAHTIVYNEDLTFKEFRIPAFRWLEADVKVPRSAASRTADVDFRVTMTSQRAVQDEDAKTLPGYERFGSREILTKSNNNLSVLPQFRNKVSYFREETTSVYKLGDYSGVYLEVVSSKRYDMQSSLMHTPRSSIGYRLYGEFEGEADGSRAAGKQLCKQIWLATKKLRPFIGQ